MTSIFLVRFDCVPLIAFGTPLNAKGLWLIGYIDRDVIEEEIAIAVTCHINDAYTEVSVCEVAHSPRATPGI